MGARVDFVPGHLQPGYFQPGAGHSLGMIYKLHQAREDLLHPVRRAAQLAAGWCRAWDMGALTPPLVRMVGAASELVAQARTTHQRPAYGVPTTRIGNDLVAVTEEVADETPFARTDTGPPARGAV